MALSSPGVDVTVIDESFYTPAEPGTVPMIFVASAENKTNGSGTGTAQGTLKANAGKPYLLTSQRELAETFGDPVFYTDSNNNPVHGGELNEYGLQAAYSLLGVSNRVYVTRADIDLGVLTPTATEPKDSPADGTNWFDTNDSSYGIFEWNSSPKSVTGGQSFSVRAPIVITDTTKLDGNGDPKESVGNIGDYAIKATTDVIRVYYRNYTGSWVKVGSTAWINSHYVAQGTVSNPTLGAATNLTIAVGSGSAITVAEGTDLTDTITTANADASFQSAGISFVAIDGKFSIFNDGSTDERITIADTDGLLGKLGLTAGTFDAPKLQISAHTSVPEFKSGDTTPRPTGSVWLKTTEPNQGANWKYKRYNANTQLFDNVSAPIYGSAAAALYWEDRSGGGVNLPAGTTFVKSNAEDLTQTEGSFTIFSRANTGATIITGSAITASTFTAQSYAFNIAETDAGKTALQSAVTINFTASGATGDADLIAGAINSSSLENIQAEVTSDNKLVVKHTQGGDFTIADTDGAFSAAGFVAFVVGNPATTTNLYNRNSVLTASNWKKAVFTASDDAPGALAAQGALWYNSVVDEVDMMIHNGTTWVGYQNFSSAYANTNPTGPIVSATEPTQQTDATALVDGDLWVSTADLENYPLVYRYDGVNLAWTLVDTTDQTTENGVLFADARYNTAGANSDEAGSIVDLLTNNYLDPDAPDPALYPKGMLLWNLRRSGFNVKRFERNYVDINGTNGRFNNDESMAGYYPHRWVTESGNQADGSGSFGRIAQRKVVVQALQAMLNSNDDIRDDESRLFNVMATPAYPELIGEMVSLNYDRGLSAFIVGDSPMRLAPDATSLNEWATNVRKAVEDNDDGLVSFDEYLGIYYPAGFTSDNAGNNIVVPASHMALRTIALSDQVSFPWFAPAGTRRGGVTNATAAGHINSEGEFVSVALNEGQRDTLYAQAINPVTFLSGSGLVVFGQKTRARNASALDRINVARLVVYLRSQLNKLAKPYLFEPNDKITRDEIKGAAESLMLELVGQRALYDFLVVCDESNNTPSRIDRNELYLDIAIEPVKAVEFIYIPLRLKNTGEIAGL